MNFATAFLFRHGNIRTLWQILLLLITLPLHLLVFIIPKSPHTWIFANSFGPKDNCYYLFHYIQHHHPQLRAVWIETWKEGNEERDHYYRYSLAGLWLQYRAKVCFAATGFGDFARFTLGKTNVIQVGHGIAIKKMLLDSPEALPFNKQPAFLKSFLLSLLKKNLNRYSFVPASSLVVQRQLMSAYGLPEEKVPITGYPRHDIISQNATIKQRKLKSILYAPTWRKDIQMAFTIVESICNLDFIEKAAESGFQITLSIHPLNNKLLQMLDTDVLASINQIINDDINYELSQTDVLITDYSSIAIDFALLKRKIILYTPDLENYLSSRGIYKELRSLYFNHGITQIEDVHQQLKLPTEAWVREISETYFAYNDSNSQKRLIDLALTNFSTH